MIRCSVKPYEGSEAYTFISYSHEDKALVFPILERMAQDGYRIWYDEGIDPGSEWPETIAQHLDNCASFISFISSNSLSSSNCRREINYSLKKNKPFISVILENVEMSSGMDMQLSANQSVFKYFFEDEEDFFSKLYEAKFLKDSLSERNPAVAVEETEETEKSEEKQTSEEETTIKKIEDNQKKKERITKKQKAPNTVKVKKQKDKTAKSKKTVKKIFLITLAVLAFSIALSIIIINLNKVTVAGNTYFKSEKLVYITDKTVSKEDILNINKIRNTTDITFDNCTFKSGSLEELTDSKAGLEVICLKHCTGFGSISFINSINKLNELSIIDCDINDSIAELDLSNHNMLTKIDLSYNSGLSEIGFISPLKNTLISLSVDGTSIDNFVMLQTFPELRNLSANACGIKSISSLENIKLQNLYLSNNNISDITTLSAVTTLETLDLSNNKIKDISPLSELQNLSILNLSDNNISSIEALTPVSSILKINIKNNKIRYLKGLENSLKLCEIIADNNDLTGVYELSNCTVLEIVSLSNNGLVSIDQLEKSSETLTSVYLSGNYLEDEDLKKLSKAENIRYLDISHCSIYSLEPLLNLTKLEQLDVSGNKLTSLNGIGFAPLQYLNASDNKIIGLNSLPNAVESTNCIYDLSNNKIASLPVFDTKMQFKKFFIHGNNITNFDSLALINAGAMSISITDVSNSEIEKLSNSHVSKFYVVDSPADRKVKCEELLSNVVFVDSNNLDDNMKTGIDIITHKDKITLFN